jgi:putative ABC transport system permease protein
MRWLRRLRHWLHLRRHHAELMDELTFHREMIERDLVNRGVSPADARTQARRAMGNETLMRENARGVWLWPSLESMWQDVVYTLRDLRRHPTFTLGVMLTLGLGLGANTAMFSLVDRLLFRPPAHMVDPSSVHRVYLYRTTDGTERETGGGRYVRYADLARWSTAFSRMAAFVLKELAVGRGDDTRVRNIAVVSAEFFDFFNAPPLIGRYFTTHEDTTTNPAPVAVLSHAAWQSQFGGRDTVIGSTVQIDAVAYTIIGVAPADFVGLWPYRPPAAFVPVTTFAASRGSATWATNYGTAIGLGILVRRKPTVTVADASADLTSALRRSYQVSSPQTPLSSLRPRAVAASVLAERGPQTSSVVRAAMWLSGVTVIVLLIACANVANLLLARTIRRRREIAVRVALGVSRSRLLGQLLTEGLVLSVLGGIMGILIAVWGGAVLSAAFLPGTDAAPLLSDARTVIFTAAVALGVGVLTGLAPITRMELGNLAGDLKSGVREGTHRRRSLRSTLLLLQSALSVVLLVGAGLFVQSLRHVRDVRLGFDADSVLLVGMQMRDTRLDSAAMVALRLRLLEAAKSVPGVSHVSLRESTPFAGESSWPIFVAGTDSTRNTFFYVNTVSADYFATMGTRILRGRAIATTDVDGAPRVAVISESMGKVLWPGQDPIGRCFRVNAESMPCTTVVGVAEDIRSQTIAAEPDVPYYYLPAAQWRPHDGGLFVRVGGDANRLVEPLRRQLQRAMPGTSFVTVAPLAGVVDEKMRSWIVGAKMFTAFGLLALLLAAVGLYSVIAYNVTQRKHELGVRLALGAARSRIVRLVVTQSVRVAVAGIVIGGVVALWAARWIAPLLYHQSPYDPVVFGIVALVLLAVAIAASSIPAVRASLVDPKAALQSD